MTNPAICILLTTYKRPECALRTIRALKENLIWDQVTWHISDDGSPREEIQSYIQEIGPNYKIEVYNSDRRGVGHGMNHSLRKIFTTTDLVLVLEDDWLLNRKLEIGPYVNTLMNHDQYGMIRFGYIYPNLLGYTVSEEGKIFWRLEPNQETYIFCGHAALRHKRFHEAYGYYDEGLTPGLTELSMAGKMNVKYDYPRIMYPAECGAYGFFDHIGSVSLADIEPEGR